MRATLPDGSPAAGAEVALAAVDEALLELDVTTRSLAQAAENLRMAGKSYNAGMEPLSDLLEAQVLYQQALARQVEARCQLSLSVSRYRKATGQALR